MRGLSSTGTDPRDTGFRRGFVPTARRGRKRQTWEHMRRPLGPFGDSVGSLWQNMDSLLPGLRVQNCAKDVKELTVLVTKWKTLFGKTEHPQGMLDQDQTI